MVFSVYADLFRKDGRHILPISINANDVIAILSHPLPPATTGVNNFQCRDNGKCHFMYRVDETLNNGRGIVDISLEIEI